MPDKVFRITTIVMSVFLVVAGIAATSVVDDDAAWDVSYLAVSSAMAPYLISATIVWSTGEIIKQMRSKQKDQA